MQSTQEKDVFAALADDRRRRMLDVLKDGELRVTEIVVHLGIRQPEVSKHLTVLRQADLVRVRQEGRDRFYRLNGDAMKPVHDWVNTFEKFWDEHLLAIKRWAEAKHLAEAKHQSSKGSKR